MQNMHEIIQENSGKVIENTFLFSNVPARMTCFKIIQIKNLTKSVQHYNIRRNPISHPPNDVFEVVPLKMTVKPEKLLTFRLKFSPDTACTLFCDYFDVWDSSGLCLEFGVKGNSIGPEVHASVNRLQFTCSSNNQRARRTVELKNDSSIEAIYQFDVDLKNSVFKLDTIFGSIGPGKHIYVEITFLPTKPGIYAKDLFCIIYDQRPLKIRLNGSFSPDNMLKELVDPVQFMQSGQITDVYDMYFSDSLSITDNPTSLTINTNNVDFGPTDLEQSSSVSLIVTNTTSKDILFCWNEDVDNIFVIEPQSIIIYGYSFVTFQAQFCPMKKDYFFSTELDGYGNFIDPSQEMKSVDQGYKSMQLSVRMMGNSFSKEQFGWIPQYDIPNYIKMPACVPAIPVYSTFMIKRLGHLPLQFKFTPPQCTHYQLKPMQGVITHAYQIVSVQMCPVDSDEKSYCERWRIQFNSSSREAIIEFHTYAEYARLETLTQPINEVRFPTMFVGCEETMIVPIQNVSRHSIWYKNPSPESPIDIRNNHHFIAPNEVIYQKWLMKPREFGRHEIEVKFEIVALREALYPVGTAVDMEVLTFVDCEYVKLVALPWNIDFGASQLDIKKILKFRLFNFGRCEVPFKLDCVHRSITLQTCEQDIVIHPNYGKLPSKNSTEITVCLCPSQMGLQEFAVSYQILKNEWSKELTYLLPTTIVNIDYKGILPTIKVLELKSDFFGGIMLNKVQLWQCMNINKLNDAFANTLPNSSTVVDLYFPEAPVGSLPLTIYLYCKNIGRVSTIWKAKRQRNCSCVPVEKNIRISFKDKVYDCKHRDIFRICKPCEVDVQVGELHVMKLLVQYHMEGCWELIYVIELSNNRKIQLNAHIVAFSADIPFLSTFNPTLSMQSVFIGDNGPALQFFWLYNNSNKDAEYQLSTTQLETLNKGNFKASIMCCMNPMEIIKSKSIHPVIFSFDPIEMRHYQARLTMQLGSKETELSVSGDGAISFDNNIRKLLHKAPILNIIRTAEVPIILSTDHIVVGKPFLTNSRTDRIFFIENQTHEAYGYKWNEYTLDTILKVTVSPPKGVLEPFETHQLKVTVESQNYPALITVSVSADVQSMNEKRLHDKILLNHQEIEKKLQGEFVITEAGLSTPVNTVIIPPAPKQICLVLAVTCHISDPTQMDMKFGLCDQLKLTPATEIALTLPTKTNLTDEVTTNVLGVLENIIWEELNSKWFEKAVSDLYGNGNSHYCQFPMNQTDDQQSAHSSLTTPSRELIQLVINQAISANLQEKYVLDKSKEKKTSEI